MPRHAHENEQVSYVLKGALRFWLGEGEEEERVVRADSFPTTPFDEGMRLEEVNTSDGRLLRLVGLQTGMVYFQRPAKSA